MASTAPEWFHRLHSRRHTPAARRPRCVGETGPL